MIIEITVRHFNPAENVREYALKKVNKIHKYFPKPISCHVILTHESNGYTTDITLAVSGKKLFVSETSDDLFKSIDGAVDKSIARALKFKSTRYAHK
ncbi:MAG: ribosome-associated translation inhibitor RaiA [Candidatus Neomarinimicrobiota bacterium]